MNHPIHWLYQQHIGSIPSGAATCYLCGYSCGQEHTVAKGIADTFNSHALAKSPSSPWLCAACQWYFDGKAGHPDFRKMSLIVYRGAWGNWQRERMKDDIVHWLAHGLIGDAYLACSLSKKKHILLQAPLNLRGTNQLAIQVEEQVAHLDYATWEYIDRRFLALLRLGHNKGEIMRGNLYGQTLRKHGQLGEALTLSRELAQWRNSPVLELLSYVTIVEKEENNGTDSGIGGHPGSITALESRVVRDRLGVQEQVPYGHLDAGGKQRGSVRTDDEHIDTLSQQPLC